MSKLLAFGRISPLLLATLGTVLLTAACATEPAAVGAGANAAVPNGPPTATFP